MSKLKFDHWEKLYLAAPIHLTALTVINDEILVGFGAVLSKSSIVWIESSAVRSNLASLMHSYGRLGSWDL